MTETTDALTHTLGSDSGVLQIDTYQALAEITAHLAMQAQRELLIQDPILDPAVYDQEPFVQAVKRLALARPGCSVRILLSDPRSARQRGRGHRLLDLAQRLTSRIAIQRMADEEVEQRHAFLIVDGTGYVRRRLIDRLEAVADYGDSPRAKRWRLEFEGRWERSVSDIELRQLFI